MRGMVKMSQVSGTSMGEIFRSKIGQLSDQHVLAGIVMIRGISAKSVFTLDSLEPQLLGGEKGNKLRRMEVVVKT